MSVRVPPHPSIVRSVAVWSVVLLMTLHATADSIVVLDAVSREVAVRVESTQGQGKVELVRNAVSREVAVRVESTQGQGKVELVRDALSREVAVRVESTQGQGKVELVRDAVSREVAVRVTLPDCSTNTLVPASASVPAAGGAGSVTIGTNSASCGWQASSSVDWVSITSGGTGNGLSGIVSYLIAANSGTSPRVGTIVAQDAVHVVTQLAALDCNANDIGDSFEIAQGLVPDCDLNGIPDPCDVAESPLRDFDGSGTLDVCEGRTYWIGGESGDLADASSWSGGLPSGTVPAVFDTGSAVTVASAGGTLSAAIVVRSGSVTLVTSAPLTVPSLSVEPGASLAVSGRLLVLGDATVLSGGRLALSYDGWLSVNGRLDCSPLSSLVLGLRISDEPFVSVGSGSFLGGIDVVLGSVSPWTVEAGTRFALVETPSLESDGFFASLFSPGLGPNLLAVVGPGSSIKGIERLEVEVIPLTQLLQPTDSGSAPVTGTPTALEVAQLTDDEFEDAAVTVSFGADADGLLYLLQSAGSGTFSAVATYPTDRDPRGVRAGRFDDTDQTLDLAVTSAGSATLRAYRNLSQTVNGFEPGPAASTVADPRGLASVTPEPAAASLLGGTDAVVVAGSGSNALQGFSSGGAGVFVPKNAIQLGRRPGGVSTVRGSSRPDRRVTAALAAAVGMAGGGAGEVVTVRVDPDGTIALTGSALGPSLPTDVECRDLDGDGLPDVVVTSEDGSVSVLRGTPAGLSAVGSFPAGTLPARDGAVGDFDGDGRPDLAVASLDSGGSSGSKVSVFLNESVPGGVPTFRPAGSFAEGKGVRLVESGRITADAGDGLVTVGDDVAGTNLAGEGGAVVTIVRFSTPEFAACLGDFDGNRSINAADLTVLLTLWGMPGLADLTGDGITDAVDLANLLARWGPCDS